MKVAIDARVMNNKPTGVENYTDNLLSEYRKNNEISFTVFLTKEIADKYKENNFNVIIGPSWHAKIAREWFLNITLNSIVNSGNINIFHSVENICPLNKIKAKTVVTVQDIGPFLYPETLGKFHRERMRMYIRHAINNADMIITPTNAVANEIKEIYKIKNNNISVVYHGISEYFYSDKVNDYKSIISQLGINRPYLLCVGTIQPRKNLENVFKAFKIISEKAKNEIMLIHVGSLGWLYKSTLELKNSYKMKDSIKMLGYVDLRTLKILYENALAFMYLSKYEGFGLPIIEAMACGVPVITSNIPALSEVAGDAGVLVNPNSPEEIASSTGRIIEDTETSRLISIKSRKRAALFTSKMMAESTIKVYKNIM